MSHTTIRLIGILALVLLGGATVGTAGGSPGADVASSGDPVADQEGGEPSAPANNSTQHENPDEVGEDGDLDQLTGWLGSRLADQLSQSTIQLSQGEYERARGVLGDEYNERLAKYVDVAGDTAGGGDDETAETFEQAQDEQDAYVAAVEDYRATRAEYREAKANGNEARARDLARNMSETATRIQQLNGTLTGRYQTIETHTGTSMTEEQAILQNITQNITAQQEAITEAEFVTTRLTVQAEQASISFTNPLRLQGTITTANGTPLANETAIIVIANQSYEVTLDAEGAFSLAYRPIRLPIATDTVRVRYRPPRESQYLGANTTVPVDVAPTTPNVGVSVNATEVAYGDVVRVTGRVAAGEQAVPDLPVELTLGSRTVGSTTTTGDGTYTQLVRIGASPPPGTHSMRAVAGFADRAIGRANASTQLRMVETPTDLSVNGAVDGTQVVLSGRLQTVDSQPVPDQSVELALTDQEPIAVTTNASGHFRTTVPVQRFDRDATATITATYHGDSTNLESAQADTQVAIPAAGSDFGLDDPQDGAGLVRQLVDPATRLPLGLGLVGLLAVVAGGWAVYRRRRGGDAGTMDAAASAPSSEPSASAVGDGARAAVDAARTRHRSGDAAAAIEVLYPTVRQSLTRSFDLPETGTHWEFYHAVTDRAATADWAPVVRALTESYEQVAYAETDIDGGDVDALLQQVSDRLDALTAESPS